MKHKLYLAFLILFASFSLSFGLTPKEREIVLHAKNQLEAAVAEQQHSKDLAAWAMQSNQEAWDYAGQTKAAADLTGQEIKTAHQHEKEQASYITKLEPVYKAVTRWFSLGAFVWGTQQLLKHLVILALFGIGLMLAFWGLTFVFPFLLPVFRIVTGLLTRFLKSIENRIEKK
jgi:hypothetical protein